MCIRDRIEALYLASPAEGAVSQEVPFLMLLPLWALALSTLYFGLVTDITLGAAKAAASGLMSGSSGMF